MSKSIQLGLRIDEELNKEIEFLSENEGVDKMAWIRRALADFINQEKDFIAKEAVKDFIKLIINESELKEYAGFKKIPSDIINARKQVINKLVKNEN
jgi:predicted transcriptional regulator